MRSDRIGSSAEARPPATNLERAAGSPRSDRTSRPPTKAPANPHSQPKAWRTPPVKKALQIIVSLVLLVAIFWYVLRQFADLSEVWAAMTTLTTGEIAFLAAATIWNLVTYWIVVVLATPALRLSQAAVLTQSTTAVANSVPAGGAIAVGLTYTMLSSWGFSKSRSTLSVLVTGIWNNFIKLGMPIVALAILALQGERSGGRLLAAIAGLGGLIATIAIFALILKSEGFARRAGLVGEAWMSSLLRLARRERVHGWDVAITKWRSRVLGLVQHRWISLTGSTMVSHVSLFAVLLLSLRVMGIPESEVGWAQALVVFAFARLLTAIPLTPGGVGVVELALIAGLSQGSGDDGRVVAAVLMFRLLTYVLPVVIGACTYLYWRRNRSWRDSAPPLSATGDIVTDQERRRRYAGSYVVTDRGTLTPRVGLVGLLAGLAAFGGSTLLAKQGLAPGEEPTFVAINALPDSLYFAIWPFMQYGVFLTIPVLSVVALLIRRVRLAITMAIAGIGVYLLARVIKEVAKRGRPEALFDSVEARETFARGSLGFPSGHAAVAAALTVVVTPHLRGRWRVVPAALLVIVCVGRMYVGAHAPLDLIGGAALGASAGFAANLLMGTASKPTIDTNAVQAVPEVPFGREHEIAAPVPQSR